MRENYDESLRRVLAHEGGYSNDAADPGGPTKYGITIHDYRLYINKNGTASDVRNMSIDDAKTIYRKRYWDALDCDDLPSGVDYTVFDYGVNSGIARSAKVLAKFKGQSPRDTIVGICDERLAFLKRLKTWPVFGKGWGRRVAEVKAASLKMASAKPIPRMPPDVEPVPVPKPKPAIKSKSICIWCAIVVLALLAYVVWERNKRPDIQGWFK
jgi:lysozyme family protein